MVETTIIAVGYLAVLLAFLEFNGWLLGVDDGVPERYKRHYGRNCLKWIAVCAVVAYFPWPWVGVGL